MRRNYSYVILATLVIGVIVGLFTSRPGEVIRAFNVPLMVIMIAAMGFTITFRSLGAAFTRWREFLLGFLLNFAFAPVLCWLIATTLLSKHPDFAAGVILIGVVPCAGMALVWAGLLQADVPLATVINAATMIAAPLLIPVLLGLFARAFVAIDVLGMFQTVLLTVLVPVLAGVVLRQVLQRKVEVKNVVPLMPAISATAAVLLMFVAVNTAVPSLVRNVGLLGPLLGASVLIFPLLFLSAFLASRRAFGRDSSVAITYSAGMKNLPIALGLGVASFKGLVMLPVAAGFAFQMITAVVFYQIMMRTASRTPKATQTTQA
jgi:predicted Na+-dependent transporter